MDSDMSVDQSAEMSVDQAAELALTPDMSAEMANCLIGLHRPIDPQPGIANRGRDGSGVPNAGYIDHLIGLHRPINPRPEPGIEFEINPGTVLKDVDKKLEPVDPEIIDNLLVKNIKKITGNDTLTKAQLDAPFKPVRQFAVWKYGVRWDGNKFVDADGNVLSESQFKPGKWQEDV